MEPFSWASLFTIYGPLGLGWLLLITIVPFLFKQLQKKDEQFIEVIRDDMEYKAELTQALRELREAISEWG